MKSLCISGGEQHLGEVTGLAGDRLRIVGVCGEGEASESIMKQYDVPRFQDTREMLGSCRPELLSVANANDLRCGEILAGLEAGCDVICDKPLAVTDDQQRQLERALAERPGQRVLNLLTLRGQPTFSGLREVIRSDRIGRPAFTHVRMAVRLKRAQRPPWFLDCRRSGGLFLDLLIHGLDQVEWLTGRRIVAMTAATGNLGHPGDEHLRDHASVFCELDDGSTAQVEGQRMLPDTAGSDYRVLVAGTKGFADLQLAPPRVTVTDPETAGAELAELPEARSVVADWLDGGDLVSQDESLRANRLALLATRSAEEHQRIEVTPQGELSS
jgi:predicted dehydrogenase